MKLNSIQFLRAVAALLVVYEHSMEVQAWYGVSAQQRFFHLPFFGSIGVDIFFVISGFIITFVAYKYMGVSNGIHFLAKRFCRINPTYYIASLLGMGIYILTLKLTNQSITGSLQQIGLSLSDTILIIPSSNNVNSFSPLLSVGWTLSFEWLFYSIFFFLILFKIRQKVFFLSGAIGVLIVIGRLLVPQNFLVQFITNPILFEFLLGVIICHLYLKLKRIPTYLGASLLLLGVAAYILIIVYGFGNIWYFKSIMNGQLSLNRFLLWGIPSSFIVAGCVILEKNALLSRIWNNKFALLCGDASYSIYLIHFSIFNLLKLAYPKTGHFLPADALIWFQIIVGVAVSLAFYKAVEKPLLHYMNTRSLLNTTLIPAYENLAIKEESFKKLPKSATI